MRRLKKILANIPGWSTSRRIVVFVSDDWGAIRTPSEAALERLRQDGVRVDLCHYMSNDRLESAEDLQCLFEILQSVEDGQGRHPVLTANFLTANPDFERIRSSDFCDYYSKSLLETYAETAGAERNMEMWQEAMSQHLCLPQSHGREHLNVARWMADLRRNDTVARAAFDHGMFGVSASTTNPRRKSYLAAFDGREDKDSQQIVSDALSSFREIFGFDSRSFIAPNYVWGASVESEAKAHGVDYIQSGAVQWLPEKGKKNRRRHFQGQRNSLGQRYLVRNVHFEPSSDSNTDWVGLALRDIEIAFKLRKPAIVSTHRVSFMGGLQVSNRDRGLELLKRLLGGVASRWPNVEFLSAVELGDAMSAKAGAK